MTARISRPRTISVPPTPRSAPGSWIRKTTFSASMKAWAGRPNTSSDRSHCSRSNFQALPHQVSEGGLGLWRRGGEGGFGLGPGSDGVRLEFTVHGNVRALVEETDQPVDL